MGLLEHKKEQEKIYKEHRYDFWLNVIIVLAFVIIVWVFVSNGYSKNVEIKSFANMMAFDAFDYSYLNGFFHRLGYFLKSFNFDVFTQNINNFFSPAFFHYFKTFESMKDTGTVYKNYLILIISLILFSKIFFWGIDFKNKFLKPVEFFLDFIFYYSLYPLERMLFATFFSNIKEKTLKDFHLLEKQGFFTRMDELINRSYVEIDGLKRSNIYYMSFYQNAFYQNGKYDFETRYMLSCFKSRKDINNKKIENEIEDLMRLYEAEIADKNKPKNFDIFDEKEYSAEELKNYKAFKNGKVLFSPCAIETFMEEETENFKNFIQDYLIYGRSFLTIQVAKLRTKIINSRHWITDMLFALDKEDEKFLTNSQKAINRIKEEYEYVQTFVDDKEKWWEWFFYESLEKFLIAQFRLILFYSIMQRYCNMPIGLIIVKIQDYTTRMILDNFKLRAILFLKPNINDGMGNREKGARNDLLAQLFFYSFNYYEKIKGSIDTRINEKFDVMGMSIDEKSEMEDNEKLFKGEI